MAIRLARHMVGWLAAMSGYVVGLNIWLPRLPMRLLVWQVANYVALLADSVAALNFWLARVPSLRS